MNSNLNNLANIENKCITFIDLQIIVLKLNLLISLRILNTIL